jgi:nitrite reductase/ring-hydroxylating ferredoxin subunit
MLRKTVYGVADAATLGAIAEELGKRPRSAPPADGSIEAKDDMGFVLGFQVTVRRAISMPPKPSTPGAPARAPTWWRQRGRASCRAPVARGLLRAGRAKAEAFYVERLGFRCTDRFTGVGPSCAAGTLDHHTLFLIQTPPFMKGCEHFTFHMGGPTEVMQAGTRFVDKGYQSFWGPGRHKFGSNWFWYFNSPLGCHVEYDADMDLHDAEWTARTAPMSADASQLFLFQSREKWAPAAAATGRTERDATCRLPPICAAWPNCPTAAARLRSREQRQDSLFVVRQGGRLFGYRDQCPHYGDTPMAWRRHAYLNADGSRIVCAAHGALSVDDGVCVQGPCLGQALTPVPLTINCDGEVHLMRASGRPRADEVEQRTRDLLQVAAELFMAQGYAHVSLRTIAAEARVAARTIYAKFGGKLGLFEAVVA